MKREKLRIARVVKNLTQKEVAAYIEVKQPFYSKIENGKAKPSLLQAKQLARVLNININSI